MIKNIFKKGIEIIKANPMLLALPLLYFFPQYFGELGLVSFIALTNTRSIDLEKSSSQYLSITDANQTGLDLSTTPFTLSAWIKLESLGSFQGIISKRQTIGTGGGYTLFVNSSNKLALEIGNGGGADVVISNTTLTTGVWYFVTALRDGTNMEVWINGVDDSASVVADGAEDVNNSEDFAIGAYRTTTPDNFFDGLIDQANVFNDARSSAELLAEYNSGNGFIYDGDEAGLVGYWEMENDLLDKTSNDNDLTNNNSATFSTDVPFVGVINLALTETLTFVDTQINLISKAIDEVITLVDDVITAMIFTKLFTETITLVDTLIKQIGKTFDEVITLADSIIRDMTRTLEEVITLVDTITTSTVFTKLLTETLPLVDFVKRTVVKVFEETITLVDQISIQKSLTKLITETLTLVDSVKRTFFVVYTEALTLVDTFEKVLIANIFIKETLNIVDRLLGKINGVNFKWHKKYTDVVSTYFKKYLDN